VYILVFGVFEHLFNCSVYTKFDLLRLTSLPPAHTLTQVLTCAAQLTLLNFFDRLCFEVIEMNQIILNRLRFLDVHSNPSSLFTLDTIISGSIITFHHHMSLRDIMQREEFTLESIKCPKSTKM
jgi:hypothetical protein